MFNSARWSQVIFSTLFVMNSNSFALTGNDLQKAIQQKQQTDVMAYVSGVIDGYRRGAIDIGITASVEAVTRDERVNGIALSQRGLNCFNFPESTTQLQTLDVVRKFLMRNPEIRHKQAGDLVLTALSSAFPCK